MLNGKCKEEFEKWYKNLYALLFVSGTCDECACGTSLPFELADFYGLPSLFQQGVYMAFFRERGLPISVHNYSDNNYMAVIRFMGEARCKTLSEHHEFNDAVTEAISHANDLFNA